MRALTSGSYRTCSVNLHAAVEGDEEEEPNRYHDDDHPRGRPYFEVLFVDQSGRDEVQSIALNQAEICGKRCFIFQVDITPYTVKTEGVDVAREEVIERVKCW